MTATGDEQVFLSYRRDETATAALGIAKDLNESFGAGTVYVDVESIEAGEAFPEELRFALERSAILIAVVGPRWAEELATRARDSTKIDYVAFELERARKSGIPILPVLVNGARMPDAAQLPARLGFVAQLHAITVADASARSLDTLRSAVARRIRTTARKSGEKVRGPGLASLLASPAQFLVRPRRFLILHSRGVVADFALVVVLSFVLYFGVSLLLGAAAGVPPGVLGAFALPVTIAMTVFNLALAAIIAALLYPVLRLMGGRGRFSRWLLVIENIRLVVAVVFMLGLAAVLFIGPEIDDGIVAWRGQLFRADESGEYLQALSEFPSYMSGRTASLMRGVFWAIGLGVILWAVFAWQSIRVIYELSHAKALVLLGTWALVEMLPMIL